eukprot:CAMPEP_0196776360 /NCGR_PEP_ID=MMETSP1104-20130614/4584_1 /TAXON_ID=33652 /ORGANISM="Cafeteria sp., Strain Caron Lab Isolate" /LENGTH=49 /DNA_ID= /DNA_START= /DNA_END= /DNA_ORIENTATION=
MPSAPSPSAAVTSSSAPPATRKLSTTLPNCPNATPSWSRCAAVALLPCS